MLSDEKIAEYAGQGMQGLFELLEELINECLSAIAAESNMRHSTVKNSFWEAQDMQLVHRVMPDILPICQTVAAQYHKRTIEAVWDKLTVEFTFSGTKENFWAEEHVYDLLDTTTSFRTLVIALLSGVYCGNIIVCPEDKGPLQ